MIKVKRSQSPKFAKFTGPASVYISSHREDGPFTDFSYVFPIEFDQTLVGQLEGDLQVRIFSSQKTEPAITLKRSSVAGTNITKTIDEQRYKNIKNRVKEKRFFFQRFIDRPDIFKQKIEFEAQIRSSFLVDVFTVEIAAVRLDGSATTVDSIEIDHQKLLKIYDIPSRDFSLTSTRDEKRIISVAAVTQDPVVSSFRFFIRKDSSEKIQKTTFDLSQISPVDSGGISSVTFPVEDSNQAYTVRAIPVSRFFEQSIGNFKEFNGSFVKNVKTIPFYVKNLTNESVDFSVFNLDSDIKKVLLFRKNIIGGDLEFVASEDVFSTNSALLQDLSRVSQFDYLYSIEYINSQGERLLSPSEIVVPALKLDSLAKVSATLSSFSASQNTAVFEVGVNYETDSLYDKIVVDIKSLGLESLLSNDLEKMTNNLKPITRVMATRISLDTGIEEDIGVFPTGSISISQENISGYIYRFEAAVRSAPEVLESLASGRSLLANNAFNLGSSVDLATKLIGNRQKDSSSFSAKFFSRSSIRNSTIRSGDSLSLSDIGYYAGRTGIFSDVRLEASTSELFTMSGLQLVSTKKGRYVSWNVSGDISGIDYAEVAVDQQKYRSFVTKAGRQLFFIGNISPTIVTVNPVLVSGNIGNTGLTRNF